MRGTRSGQKGRTDRKVLVTGPIYVKARLWIDVATILQCPILFWLLPVSGATVLGRSHQLTSPNETNVGIQSLLTNSYCLRFICVALGPERQELGRWLVPLAVPHFYLLSVMVPWPFLSFVVYPSLCGENGWWFSLWYIRLVVIHEL